MIQVLKDWASSAALSWLECILRERFGHNFILARTETILTLRLENSVREIIFDEIDEIFISSLLDVPCAEWNPVSEGWTSILSKPLPAPCSVKLPSPLIEPNASGFRIRYDILGMAYWMLSRQEEIGRNDLDAHGRFPATSSHASRNGYLERPIVDEWLGILSQVIMRTWSGIKLKQHAFSIKVSHDVDSPSRYAFRSIGGLARAMVGDVIKRCDLKNAILAPSIWVNSRNALHIDDPYNTFDWIMDVSERQNMRSAFYFISGRTNRLRDADYEISHPAIRKLIKKIHIRGHEIGLHPSYGSFQSSSIIAAEANLLRRIAEEEGVVQIEWGGRMHYLMWEHPATLQGWEHAGLTYDSTMGYADRPGFRCGTCFEYPAFDPIAQKRLNLRIRPLVAMECTVMDSIYMGLGSGDLAFEKFIQLKNVCKAVLGSFTLLWHNSQFDTDQKRHLYISVLEY